MKKVTRIFAMLFTILTLSSICVPIVAQATETDKQTIITKFEYTVFDKDGNIIKKGTTPNFMANYSWSGITLSNGQMVVLTKTNGSSFYIGSGRRIFFSFDLNRFAETNTRLCKGANIGFAAIQSTRAQGESPSFRYDITETGLYHYSVENMSSDPITITYAELTF